MQESSEKQSEKTGLVIFFVVIIVILIMLIASYSNSGSTNSHICEVSGCNKKGEYAIEGFNGTKEYYCYEHYSKLMNNMKEIFGN